MDTTERRVTRTRINEDTELVVFEENGGYCEIHSQIVGIVSFCNEDAYKVYTTLQSLLFSNVPYVESYCG